MLPELKSAYEKILTLFPADARVWLDVETSFGRFGRDGTAAEVREKQEITLVCRTADGEWYHEFNCTLEEIEKDAERLLREMRKKQRALAAGGRARGINQVA